MVCGASLVDALPGELGEVGVDLHAEPVAVVLLGDDGGGAGADEGVEDDAWFAGLAIWGAVAAGGQCQAEGFSSEAANGADVGGAAGAAAPFGAAG